MFAGVGERTREGNDLYREMIESVSSDIGTQQTTVQGLAYLRCIIAAAPAGYISIL